MPLTLHTTAGAASLFLDSGAFSLFSRNVLKSKPREEGEELPEPTLARSRDYSFFTLKKGSEFREYCDGYAAYIKWMLGKVGTKCVGDRLIFANVDVIYNPELTWETQCYFEQEHGIVPVPVVHFRTPMKWVDHYLTAGKYDLLGVGGFAWGGDFSTTNWLDAFFRHICPESNGLKPIIRVHGFALTGWTAICRWPWWSVDSTSWLQCASYGGVLVPCYSDRTGKWLYDRPPKVTPVSARSPSQVALAKRNQNFCRWLKELNLTWEEVAGPADKEEKDQSYSARFFANLTYFKNLEESRPEWPHPLDIERVHGRTVEHRKGFGL